MFVLIPVAAEAGLDAFGEHLACVVCFVPYDREAGTAFAGYC